jgi:hypothetical protein
MICTFYRQWHRYQEESKFVSLWEDMVGLEWQNSYLRDQPQISERSRSGAINLHLSDDAPHKWSLGVRDLASSIAIEATACMKICVGLKDAVSAADWCREQGFLCASINPCNSGVQANYNLDPGHTISLGRADGIHCSVIVPTSGKSSFPEQVISDLQMQMQKETHDLESAKEEFSLRERQLLQEILRYVEEEQKLSLLAVEREEELEAVVREKLLLTASQEHLSSLLAEAHGQIQHLRSTNQMLIQELSRRADLL